VQVHRFIVPTENRQIHWRFICSDLHIGSVNFDAKRWRQDMDAAVKVGARVLVNGDVFDAIDFRDKRYDPSVLVPELKGEKDLQGAVVRLAFEYFKPYADVIDVMGIGNHEEKWINWNSNDPVARLNERLNADLQSRGSEHRIRHGGISGFIRTTFRFTKLGSKGGKLPSVNHDLLYFHGSGGDSPVTRGTIDFYRKEHQFSFDAVTMGHKHNRGFVDSVEIGLSARCHLLPKDRKSIQTGSYYQNYKRTGQKNPLDYSYAERFHASPKPLGGMFLRLRPFREHIGDGPNRTVIHRVEQEVMTSP
jgi:hypothetical protein